MSNFQQIHHNTTSPQPLNIKVEGLLPMAADLGFEPRQTESESVVLPLHKSAIFESSLIQISFKVNILRAFISIVTMLQFILFNHLLTILILYPSESNTHDNVL